MSDNILRPFQPGGSTYSGLDDAREFFAKYATKIEESRDALVWFMEEVGELAHVVRSKNSRFYPDAIGDVMLWVFTLARLLDVNVADCLSHSVGQMLAKGHLNVAPLGVRDAEPPR